MDKRGLLGKIFLIIGILIILVIIVIVITIYQAISFLNIARVESLSISNNAALLIRGDCSRFKAIEDSALIVREKAKSTCKNPLIDWTSSKITSIPFNCKNITQTEEDLITYLATLKQICESNQTIQTASILGV